MERKGISRSELKRLNERGLVERVSRGVYALPGVVLTEITVLRSPHGEFPAA